MTNPPPNPLPDDLDEAVTAYLDGEATPDEVARVEADANLQARVEVFAAVRERVRQPVPATPGALDGAVAAALAAFDSRDEAGVVAAAGAAPDPVVLSQRRLIRFAPILAAVAGLVVIAGLVSVLARAKPSDDAATASAELAEGGRSVAAAETSDAAAKSAVAGNVADEAALPTLGEFALADAAADAASDLARQSADRGAEQPTLAASPTTTVAPASSQLSTAPATGAGTGAFGGALNCPGTAIALATVDGEPVVVVEIADPSGAQLRVYRLSDCQLLAERPR